MGAIQLSPSKPPVEGSAVPRRIGTTILPTFDMGVEPSTARKTNSNKVSYPKSFKKLYSYKA